MQAGEQALIRTTVREAIAAAAAADTRDVDGVLGQLGWLDMLLAEPPFAIEVVFDALGATGSNATALDDVLTVGVGLGPRPDLAVLLPPFTAAVPSARVESARCSGTGLATGRAAGAAELLIVDGFHGALVPASGVRRRPVRGIDPGAGLLAIEVDAADFSPVALETGAWDVAVALARCALAAQLAGAARTMLDLARTHALTREQFGHPIARFQAVRHRLAESFVAIEALEAARAAATDTPGAETARLAKAVAGRTARVVGAHCQQVLAGIGFTTDHAFHRYLKRSLLLDGLFGSADDLVVEIGRELVTNRSVPTLVEL